MIIHLKPLKRRSRALRNTQKLLLNVSHVVKLTITKKVIVMMKTIIMMNRIKLQAPRIRMLKKKITRKKIMKSKRIIAKVI